MAKNQHKIAAKKEAVLGKNQKSNAVLFGVMALCAVLAIGGGIFFMGSEKGGSPPVASLLGADTAEAAELTFPTDRFADGKSRFFEHRTADGLTIRFFVLKSSDGVIRSAFDACDSCWPAGKGYRQDGDEMVCQNCRMRFPSTKIMEVKGGCNPSPLPNRLVDGQVVIQVADVETGRGYFDFGTGREG